MVGWTCTPQPVLQSAPHLCFCRGTRLTGAKSCLNTLHSSTPGAWCRAKGHPKLKSCVSMFNISLSSCAVRTEVVRGFATNHILKRKNHSSLLCPHLSLSQSLSLPGSQTSPNGTCPCAKMELIKTQSRRHIFKAFLSLECHDGRKARPGLAISGLSCAPCKLLEKSCGRATRDLACSYLDSLASPSRIRPTPPPTPFPTFHPRPPTLTHFLATPLPINFRSLVISRLWRRCL